MRRRVIIRHFVKQLGGIGQRHKAVRKPGRHAQLLLVLARQYCARPLAERRRALADIHRDIEHLAGDHAYQLALRLLELIMQAAQHALGAFGMVVLHKIDIEAGSLCKDLAIERFKEEAALVAKYLGLDQQYLRNGGWRGLHAPALMDRPCRAAGPTGIVRSRIWPGAWPVLPRWHRRSSRGARPLLPGRRLSCLGAFPGYG